MKEAMEASKVVFAAQEESAEFNLASEKMVLKRLNALLLEAAEESDKELVQGYVEVCESHIETLIEQRASSRMIQQITGKLMAKED